MIHLVFGNVGSGKTLTQVIYMKSHPEKKFITNIHMKGKGNSHILPLKADMIIKKDIVGYKRDGKELYKSRLNIEFWRELIQKEGEINIIIDEAHIFFNPRKSMSARNVVSTDFLALLRRVTSSSTGEASCVLISQLSRRLDIISKEMATKISFMVHHYLTRCGNCKAQWWENNETANKFYQCPRCHNPNIKKIDHKIETFEFKNIDDFNAFNEYRLKSYYKRYVISGVEKYFGCYDTLQIEDLLSEY